MAVLTVHPAAAIFPMISDDEIKELAASIARHGLREPIRIIQGDEKDQWFVLDGRNRLEALRRSGVSEDQIFKNYTYALTSTELEKMDATPEEYVLMANIERRNLTPPQRRELAGKLAIMLAERQKEMPKSEKTDTTAEAAAKAGVSRRTAATAKQQVLGKTTTAKPRSAASKLKLLTPTKMIDQLDAMKKASRQYAHNWDAKQLDKMMSLCVDLTTNLTKGAERAAELKAKEEAAKKKG